MYAFTVDYDSIHRGIAFTYSDLGVPVVTVGLGSYFDLVPLASSLASSSQFNVFMQADYSETARGLRLLTPKASEDTRCLLLLHASPSHGIVAYSGGSYVEVPCSFINKPLFPPNIHSADVPRCRYCGLELLEQDSYYRHPPQGVVRSYVPLSLVADVLSSVDTSEHLPRFDSLVVLPRQASISIKKLLSAPYLNEDLLLHWDGVKLAFCSSALYG